MDTASHGLIVSSSIDAMLKLEEIEIRFTAGGSRYVTRVTYLLPDGSWISAADTQARRSGPSPARRR
jgi:hypothetical protein